MLKLVRIKIKLLNWITRLNEEGAKKCACPSAIYQHGHCENNRLLALYLLKHITIAESAFNLFLLKYHPSLLIILYSMLSRSQRPAEELSSGSDLFVVEALSDLNLQGAVGWDLDLKLLNHMWRCCWCCCCSCSCCCYLCSSCCCCCVPALACVVVVAIVVIPAAKVAVGAVLGTLLLMLSLCSV